MNLAPHPFSLRQLQYAVAVAESLSFRQAAERCHVSQPSLSAQLAQLEAVLGVRLFERDRRRVIVTVAGRGLIERARLVLRETDDLVELARCAGDPLSGTVRIGVIPTIAPYLLPHLTPAIRAAYPRLTVLWVENKTHVLVRDLDAGALDAALLALEADIGDVERETIARDPFVLLAPSGDPLATEALPVRVSELRDVSVLVLDDEHCFGEQALAFCSSTRARPHEFRATSLTTITQMVAGGAGVTLLPELSVPIEARSRALRVRAFAKPVPGRTIGLVWRKKSPLAAAFHELAATARRAYPAPPLHPGPRRRGQRTAAEQARHRPTANGARRRGRRASGRQREERA
jgi:LysR family hydrogen peroxide-inducible transcriptional activator